MPDHIIGGATITPEAPLDVEVAALSISVATVASGQITVAAPGTAVQGTAVANRGGFYVKAHPDNTDTIWVGNDGAGDVSDANGYPLDPGEQIFIAVANLNQLWFDAGVGGEKACWIKA